MSEEVFTIKPPIISEAYCSKDYGSWQQAAEARDAREKELESQGYTVSWWNDIEVEGYVYGLKAALYPEPARIKPEESQ